MVRIGATTTCSSRSNHTRFIFVTHKTLFASAILFLLFFSSIAFSQPSLTDDRFLNSGVQAFYNSNLSEAEATFNQFISQHPENPRGYFFKSTVYFWRYVFGGRDPKVADAFLEISSEALDVTEEASLKDSRSAELRLFMSGLYGYRGIVRAAEHSFIKAFLDINKSHSLTKRLIKERPDFYDAYLGAGISHYMVGDIQPEGKWMASLLGFSGTREEGLAELNTAAEKGTVVQAEALFALSYFYEKQNRFQGAKSCLDKLIAQHPNNVIFLEALSRVEERTGDLASAAKICDTIIGLANPDFQFITTNTYLMRGKVKFEQMKFSESVSDFNTYIKLTLGKKGFSKEALYEASFKAGVCYETLGEPDIAAKFFVSVGKESKFYKEAQERLDRKDHPKEVGRLEPTSR
jgi:tetratricopeptide (TPR) repeat protein